MLCERKSGLSPSAAGSRTQTLLLRITLAVVITLLAVEIVDFTFSTEMLKMHRRSQRAAPCQNPATDAASGSVAGEMRTTVIAYSYAQLETLPAIVAFLNTLRQHPDVFYVHQDAVKSARVNVDVIADLTAECNFSWLDGGRQAPRDWVKAFHGPVEQAIRLNYAAACTSRRGSVALKYSYAFRIGRRDRVDPCAYTYADAARAVCSRYDYVALPLLAAGERADLRETVLRRNGTRLLHIVADPRIAMLGRLSRVHTSKFSRKYLQEVRDEAKSYCDGVASDVRSLQDGGRAFPEISDRYYFLKYEDLTRDPMVYIADVMAFLGVAIPGAIGKSLSAPESDNVTSLKESLFAGVPLIALEEIERECAPMMGLLGYADERANQQHL